ncbi:MAG: leucyl aminopeptidase family protein [Gammaproteobacteria bacterium]|nr:leucyl aminopeptidase family protein [Gammaproteobacteria bacterium]
MLSFENNADATPIELVAKEDFSNWLAQQSEKVHNLVTRAEFNAAANHHVEITDESGHLVRVVAGTGREPNHKSLGALPNTLPHGAFALVNLPDADVYELALGWGLGSYRFTTYRPNDEHHPRVLHLDSSHRSVQDEVDAIALVRDLINTPASDMLPHHLEAAVRRVATRHNADLNVVLDKALLKQGFRTIYTVGQASASEPRLMDLTWGDEDDPKLTILGKGVCFDSGGLNLKTVAGMRSMKKDMGGAATALGLADLVMRRQLPVRLRLLIPAVENAVSGNAYRPGDVIRTYKGLTVEIGNTDAEGRLILCDALALASEDAPELMIDFATLTGAARSAVGTEISAMFSNDDAVAAGIEEAAKQLDDPVCRLPLYKGYRPGLRSPVADLCNIANFSEAGAIVAALFLEAFVDETRWVHYDINAFNSKSRPAHPIGGEAMGLRATYRYLEQSFNR